MKLTINFVGICTHFRQGVAAGVPHRVVLPDATRFITGMLTALDIPQVDHRDVLYYLMPHFPQLDIAGTELDVPSLTGSGGPAVKNGDILSPVRLQVVNAIDDELTYSGEDVTRSLTEFVPNYAFSSDVVLNGRAMCYFDLYGGRVTSSTNCRGTAYTTVEMTTDGSPELLVTPLASSSGRLRSHRLKLVSTGPIDEVTLCVKNLETAPESESDLDDQGGAFDYLFHYLTARGGIPQTIRSLTPGMLADDLVSATAENFAQTFEGMASLVRPRMRALVEQRRRVLVSLGDITPACSDSRYP